MANKRKRRTWEEQSVFAWQYRDESAADAKRRLDEEWKAGVHPTQKVPDDVQ